METERDQQTRTEPKARLVEQIKGSLRSGSYSRALDLLRGEAAEFHNDAELSGLEKRAQDGIKRKAEADRLITESQDLFARQKSAEAIQLLRQAYELDKNNSLARAILANALVEHAQSIAETDWLESEKLANQALSLNPAHPTAKTILAQIVDQKTASSVEPWVTQASKLQSSGDLFGALAWVAEGLAVHPEDPKLLGIQDSIQRDQGARRRQARRRDLEDLRRMELEIGAAEFAAKQALAERIQGMAAKYWTDGEMLSLANGLLNKLGLAPDEGPTAPSRSKGAAIIFHVPRPGPPKTPLLPASSVASSSLSASPDLPSQSPPSSVTPKPIPPANTSSDVVPPNIAAASEVPRSTATSTARKRMDSPPPTITSATNASPATPPVTTPSSWPKSAPKSSSTTLIIGFAAAAILLAATFLFMRKHHAPPVAKTSSAVPSVSAPVASPPTISAPGPVAAPTETIPESSPPGSSPSSDTGAAKLTGGDHPPVESVRDLGTLLVIAGQDDTKVFLNGKLQPQVTHAGQLRLSNLELKDYVVQVSKAGFQDPPQQTVQIRKREEAKLVFNLQPQPRLGSLTLQGGLSGTAVLIDQTPVGTIQPDGTLSVSSVTPGDHTVELSKAGYKARQFQRHFVAGTAISLATAETALEAAPGELKITFSPADAKVALVKGDHLTIVSSGVPLNLAPGTYTLTARTADRYTRSSTLEVVAGQSKTLDLSLAPTSMSKWDDTGAWKQEKDSFVHKGGDFVLYGVVPASGTFVFSAMPGKGHLLQWVLNYIDPQNYVLFQMDDNNFYRTVIRNGQKTDTIKIPDKSDKKSFRALHIRVSPTEIVHQIRHGDSWTVVDRWTQPAANLSQGKFGFYIPGNDEVALSGFAHYADLNIR